MKSRALDHLSHELKTPLSVPHDPRKVQQILRNLLSNALKHRRKRVDVTIGGDADLLVSVEDDGPGIPPKDRNRSSSVLSG